MGLTNLPPSYADCLEIWELQTCGTLRASPGLYSDCFTFTFILIKGCRENPSVVDAGKKCRAHAWILQ